jgi:hypothetical protein
VVILTVGDYPAKWIQGLQRVSNKIPRAVIRLARLQSRPLQLQRQGGPLQGSARSLAAFAK